MASGSAGGRKGGGRGGKRGGRSAAVSRGEALYRKFGKVERGYAPVVDNEKPW